MSLASFSNTPVEINFFSEEIDFELNNKSSVKSWIVEAFQLEQKEPAVINYIFCTDEYLHQINLQYLNHDTFTDIITFPNSKAGKPVSGDIFISVDRVKENAEAFGVGFDKELLRVLIHGCLHLMGYMDKTDEEQLEMTTKENFYIDLFSRMNA